MQLSCTIIRPNLRERLLRRCLHLGLYSSGIWARHRVKINNCWDLMTISLKEATYCVVQSETALAVKTKKTSRWVSLPFLMLPCLGCLISGLVLFSWFPVYTGLLVISSTALFSSALCITASGCDRQEMWGSLCVPRLLEATDVTITLGEVAPLWNTVCGKRGEEIPLKTLVWWPCLYWMSAPLLFWMFIVPLL